MKMQIWLDRLAALCTVFWVGGMWAIGYLAVPVLFRILPDRQLAGMLAGEMFTWMAFVGIVCALFLLAYHSYRTGRLVWKQKVFIATLVMLILLLIGQFGIQPIMADMKAQALPLDVMHSELAAQFKTLHGAASVMYLIQSLLGLVLVFKLSPRV
jgi:hypothetical protein